MSRERVLNKLASDPELPPEMRAAASHVGEYLASIGRDGGKARARRHSREELAKWGRIRHQKAASDDAPQNS